MTTPRVAYILKMYPRFSETFILNELLELERQGVEVRIFSLKKPDDGRFHAELSRLKARVTYLPESPMLASRAYYEAHRQVYRWDQSRYLAVLGKALSRRRRAAVKRFLQAGYLALQLRQEGFSHVHAHFASSATAVAFYAYQLAGISYSFTAHAKDIYSDEVNIRSLKEYLASARLVVTVSDYNRDYLKSIHADVHIERVYNGLDLKLYSPNGSAPDTPPLVLAVGRLVEKKGFDDLVRACDLLRREGCYFRCRIVGKGPIEAELQALTQKLGLQEYVELAGPMPREALLHEYPKASLVAAPCVIGSDGNRDGLPTVLIEAMALGVPVVSTDVTGIPELVQDGHSGLLTPQRDPRALADAIRRVLEDQALSSALRQAGRERVERHFDIRQNVRRLRTLFGEVTA
ncbi:MAG: glycosyltransferase [Chloroflexota bacterium]|nr:glycosyltransferase [Chloroflexota bacterium]